VRTTRRSSSQIASGTPSSDAVASTSGVGALTTLEPLMSYGDSGPASRALAEGLQTTDAQMRARPGASGEQSSAAGPYSAEWS
jgi:hypothetical protein